MWYSIFKSGTLDLYLNTSEYEFARHYSYSSKQSESELTGYNERNRVDSSLLEVQENLNIFLKCICRQTKRSLGKLNKHYFVYYLFITNSDEGKILAFMVLIF